MQCKATPRGSGRAFAGARLACEVFLLPPRMRRATIPAMPSEPYSETIRVPAAVRFPIELEPPEGFRPEDPASWPRIDVTTTAGTRRIVGRVSAQASFDDRSFCSIVTALGSRAITLLSRTLGTHFAMWSKLVLPTNGGHLTRRFHHFER